MRTASYIRALRGPLLLMTLGILLQIDHAGGLRIGQSWPILIVVFGAVTLIERLFRPEGNQLAPGGPHP